MIRDSCQLAVLVALVGTPIHAQTHTHGDAVGGLTPDSAVVWTRASGGAAVSVLYATNAALIGATETTPTTVGSATDYTAHVVLSGLQPDTVYWFSTKIAPPGSPSTFVLGPTGSFATPPAPGTRAPVRFITSADLRENQSYTIFQPMAGHGAQFFACLGDLPYADGSTSLAEFWAEHRNVRREPFLQAFLRNVPLIATWDDHEVENDWDATTNPIRVRNGIAAWRHWLPVPVGAPEIYRSLRWGDALELFILDTRSHRADNEAPDTPAKRMLGDAQMLWLENALLTSDAIFKVIGTSVPLRFGTTGPDHWEGYMHERRRLFDFIVDNRIENVVFLAADQHWAASNHHREGFREFQTGPAATTVRTPQSTNDPQQRWVDPVRNYGVIAIDPTVSPATLTIDWHDATGAPLRRETIAAGARARVALGTDAPQARYALDAGPFQWSGTGTSSSVEYLEAGDYRVHFADETGVSGRPAEISLTVPPDATVRIAADYHDAPSSPYPVLLADNFEGSLSGFAIIDDGTTSGPSSWFTDGGWLVQNSNIHTPGTTIEYPGTMAVTGDAAWTDYTMRLRMKSSDDDSIGCVFRYTGRGDFYRFSMDAQRGFRRLVSCVGSVYRELWSDGGSYPRYDWFDVEVTVIGNRIVIRQDGLGAVDVTDSDHPRGQVGLYTWGNRASIFDDLIVRQGDASAAGAVFDDSFDDGVLSGWTVLDQVLGQSSNWFENGGRLNQDSNINDGNPDPTHVPKLGTMAVNSVSAGDVAISANVFNSDDDAIGLVFRFVDPMNYYRFSMDSERSYRRLAVVANGTWRVLWEDLGNGYATNTWHHIAIRCVGPQLRVMLDGQLLATQTDPTHAAGTAGFYCWGSTGARFDDFRMDPVGPERAVLASVGVGNTTTIVGRAPASAGLPYLFALSTARSPGIPLARVTPGDPRVLELAPDPLFFATVTVGFPGFGVLDGSGGATAVIPWPPLPALSGVVLYCGGWIAGTGGTIAELWPTVEIVLP